MNRTTKAKRPPGRPPNENGRKIHPPPRQLGRVDDHTWQRLKDAAKRAGKPFSDWALSLLLPHA